MNECTCWGDDSFFPIMNNIIPRNIISNTKEGCQFGFVGDQHESSMFEGDNISRLRIPSPCKFCCSCWCNESNPIGSIWEEEREKGMRWWMTRRKENNITIHIPRRLNSISQQFLLLHLDISFLWNEMMSNVMGKVRNNTLCLRNELDLPEWWELKGSRRMIPSPPWSMISWNLFSRWRVSLHTSNGAISMNWWFFFPIPSPLFIMTCVEDMSEWVREREGGD